ncbi:MAG: 1-(5-phosphoribosyl)-5-[(5-phosphoribosylamino)methylideneamino]imidazole-4-carboxamide isomerase [Clostridiales bacterium]|nr:1-(5-phosphoribosyl)-5-[(5-phosphoribosylamino)methylideneamino]imidazole-4-carboxamide isomerase [Clostridiales bacterium]
MQIYPAIDIKNGQCVRLSQGRFDNVTVYGDDPLNAAGEWVRNGATYLHVVDLDGAREGTSYNNEVIRNIVKEYGVPVQTGGGVRSMRDIEEKISLGVSRVILGTVAVKDPEIVSEAVKNYGDKIAVGIDAVNGWVAVNGWEEVSKVTALELCRRMCDMGVQTIIYTDISKDGMLIGPNVQSTKEIVDATGINIIASGGISTIADLENVEAIGAQGAIIGKALYQGVLKLTNIIQRFEKKSSL